ncbi:hypothetical protein [Pedobacter sp. ASV12]|uniref:hypothetical protein n=1 Tax=Pedobacter sp. ASV12 TaxID=2795120 RepID=UPI001E588141|nr:hypothetical protein [Pedobacter sp. ASV12]
MELNMHSPNEQELAKLDLLQRRFKECSRSYADANERLYGMRGAIPIEQLSSELETAKNSFDMAEKEYRSFVFETMRKYNLLSL